MNEQWYWRLAEDRRQALMEEARQDRLAREAGYRDRAPAAIMAIGMTMIAVPLVLMLLRGWLKL